MKPVAIWIEASRPKTLICSVAPILMGTALAWKANTFSFLTFLITLLTGVAIQILTNWANDYFDFIKGSDTTERKGPRRVTQAGLVTLAEMRRALIFITLATALLSATLMWIGGPFIGLTCLLMILLAFAYTTGPLPLAYLGLGELFVLIFFGPIAMAGTYYLQTHQLSLPILCLGLAPAFLATAIISLNNLRDIDEDRQSQKKTLAVRLGKTFGRCEYTFFLIGGCALPCIYGYYLPLITLLPAIVPLKAVWTLHDFRKLNTPFAQTGKLMVLFTLLLSWSILAT